MAKRDYYEVLGVEKTASASEIKKAYYKQQQKYHPDLNPADDAEEKTKEINEAYENLSDESKRQNYDNFGHSSGGAGGGGYGGGGFGGNPFASMFGGGGYDIDLSGLGSIFGDYYGGSSASADPLAPTVGTNVETSISIDFMEAMEGVTKAAEIIYNDLCSGCGGDGAEGESEPKICGVCHGSGSVTQDVRLGNILAKRKVSCDNCGGKGKIIDKPCKKCEGGGFERKIRKINIGLPAGVADGDVLQKSGFGNAGKNGGPKGNLLIYVTVRPHAIFTRRRNDIITEFPLTYAQAVLGDKIKIPTIDGEHDYKLDSGIQPDTVITLRNKGVRFKRAGINMRGDQHVQFTIEVPKNLNKEQKEALKNFEKLMGDESSGHYEKRKRFFDKFKRD